MNFATKPYRRTPFLVAAYRLMEQYKFKKVYIYVKLLNYILFHV